jgi:predicted nucleic acid-binding protein
MRRGDRRLVESLQEASEIFLTPVVVGELAYGFIGGKLEAQNRRLLREFLESERVRVVSVDEETAERYAAIRDHLRRKGTPIPTQRSMDRRSAAQHGLKLLCLDRHFKEVPQILLEYFESST